MTKPKGFEKPTGVKDYLPEAVTRLRHIEGRVLDCMERWGYRQVMTPTLEFYDTVGVASSTSDKKLFKLLDQNGRTLVLRSDVTAPIARVVASLLRDRSFPLRLSYHSNVFRAFEEEAGRESEFYQTGVELVGDASPEADAEVIALAIASLLAAGVGTFKIAIGHVGFFNGLFRESLAGRDEEQKALKECLVGRDYVGFRHRLGQLELDAHTRERLAGILRLRGGEEICVQAAQLTDDIEARAALEHLCEMWNVLESYGVAEHVHIDLTLIGDFTYYTGMTFEGYAADLGFPVCSGGRYDNLLTQFGRTAPATGFALKTNRILELTSGLRLDEPERVLVIYDAANRANAMACARGLRAKSGVAVETRKLASGDASEQGIKLADDEGYFYENERYDDIITFLA